MIIRKFKEGDEKQIIPLLKLVFKSSIYDNEKYWNWMYKNNPINLMKIWVAEDNGKIVGHNAVIPVLMKIDNKIQLGTLELNTAVHPNYQGQGIFSALAKKLYNELAAEGLSVTYGYPNEIIYPIRINKLGWFKISSLPVLFRPLNLTGLVMGKVKNRYIVYLVSRINNLGLLSLKIFFKGKKYKPPQKINVREVSFFNDRFDEFWDDASKAYKIIVVRDKNYLKWRYLDNPNYGYTIYSAEKEGKIFGYIVLRLAVEKHSKSGMIVDFLTLSEQKDVAFSLISKAIEHFKKERADLVTCYIQNQYYYDLLRVSGFMPIPLQKYRPKFCARINVAINKEFFTDVSNWFLTNGDRSNEI